MSIWAVLRCVPSHVLTPRLNARGSTIRVCKEPLTALPQQVRKRSGRPMNVRCSLLTAIDASTCRKSDKGRLRPPAPGRENNANNRRAREWAAASHRGTASRQPQCGQIASQASPPGPLAIQSSFVASGRNLMSTLITGEQLV